MYTSLISSDHLIWSHNPLRGQLVIAVSLCRYPIGVYNGELPALQSHRRADSGELAC